ncbi:hypothetical protein [Polyangium fumosum]|uniref:Cytochrome c domain-containing protein n=1 Tax=Polyangium fumosum TaxID=889272 RepID=A0A4U1IZJ8_9BACT|nr:hypothetical protein [Polyangium fumosum]TKD00091.1 hypothetical protein E8A74_35650 [Polyangium fumosum]
MRTFACAGWLLVVSSLLACGGGGSSESGAGAGNPPTDPALDALIEAGVKAFRKPGVRGACAGCHSPDGIDIAAIDYDEATIRRRAEADQVGAEETDAIVALIDALRKKHAIVPVSATAYRPYQPGGEVLGELPPEGEMDSYERREARDRVFLASLEEQKLKILDGPIDSIDKAAAVADELDAIDLRKLRVGIPFDRWSEDPFNTPAGLPPFESVAEWIPWHAQRPIMGMEEAWYAIVDDYRADPADEAKFWRFYDAIDEMTEPDAWNGGADDAGVAWNREKWKSVQIAQHMLFRRKTDEYPNVWHGSEPPSATTGPTESARNRAIDRNPIWHVGDIIRVNPLHCTGASTCIELPDFADVPEDEDIRELQTDVIQQSWFWTAWEYDAPLLIAGNGIPSIDGDYFLSTLMNRYAIHHGFLMAKGMVAKARAPLGWLNAKAPDRDRNKEDFNAAGHGKWASPRPFLLTRQLEGTRHVVADPARQPAHTRMVTNAIRMGLYLMKKELDAPAPTVFDKESTLKKLEILKSWFHDGAWDDPLYNTGIDPLIDELVGKVAAATEIKDPSIQFPDASDIQ